jgi:hypothetical protein
VGLTTLEQLQDHDEAMEPGTRVEVRSRFDAAWSHGFEVVDATESGYRIRRLSDRMILPVEFVFDDVRKERRRQGLWWY